jgi:hypothetical protein
MVTLVDGWDWEDEEWDGEEPEIVVTPSACFGV